VFAARRLAEVVASRKDQAIEERTDPGLEERQVGRRPSLESEARIRTVRVTEGRMTGPCEDCDGELGDKQQLDVLPSPSHKGLLSDSNWFARGSDD
jgi:hypothetical protein